MSKKHSASREVRVTAAPQRFEVRTNADGSRSIAGKAVVYDVLSQALGDGFRERIASGAFRDSLRTQEVRCLYGHDANALLGRQSSGTLVVRDTPSALEFSCVLPNTQDGQTVAELASRGDLRGVSFGFITASDSWEQVNGDVIRTVTAATIFEISVVGNPAYTQSSFSLRSCPTALRSKLTRRDDDEHDDDDDDDGDDGCDPLTDIDCDDDDDEESTRCSCRCERCAMSDCANCYSVRCTERSCRDAGCPSQAQDEARADSLRVRQLFAHRMTL